MHRWELVFWGFEFVDARWVSFFPSFLRGAHFEFGGVGFAVRADVDVPTVAATKEAFLKALVEPMPSSYETAIQELLVQQHSMRYSATYTYDPIFALGVVTVFDQLMEGYPIDTDRQCIFEAYISALNEDPDLYRLPFFSSFSYYFIGEWHLSFCTPETYGVHFEAKQKMTMMDRGNQFLCWRCGGLFGIAV